MNPHLSLTTDPSVGSASADDVHGEHEGMTAIILCELEAQLRVEVMCDMLQALPVCDLRDVVSIIGAKVPSSDSGERLTETALVDIALAHLHEEMHRGGDNKLGEYETTINLHVKKLVDAERIADPLAATVLEGEAKTQPMSKEEHAQALMDYLRHKIDNSEDQDLTVDQDALSLIYQRRGEDSNDDSDSESLPPSPSDAESASEGSNASPPDYLSTTSDVEPRMTVRQIRKRIERLKNVLKTLPEPVFAEVVSGTRARWLAPDPDNCWSGDGSRKDAVLKISLALLTEAAFGSKKEVISALEDFEQALQRQKKECAKRFLAQKIEQRGLSLRNSKLRARRLDEMTALSDSSESCEE